MSTIGSIPPINPALASRDSLAFPVSLSILPNVRQGAYLPAMMTAASWLQKSKGAETSTSLGGSLLIDSILRFSVSPRNRSSTVCRRVRRSVLSYRERDNLERWRGRGRSFSTARLSYRKISRALLPLLPRARACARVRVCAGQSGPVVVDFLCPPVDNDQHLPQQR